MTSRKKKIKIIQLLLFFFGILIIYFTYYGKEINNEEKIISKSKKERVEKQIEESSNKDSNIFFNVEYTGLDLNGNRYLLKSNEAELDKTTPEIVLMKTVHATFYFKDDTIMYVWSDEGVYNNKTLDMKFKKNVRAEYLSSELFAEKAEFSNSKNYLSIYENVKINDIRGNLIADKLLFDISKQKLDITSFNNGKINANVNLDEKRF
tara:strand:+ start:137 stop:757 length:621 start_codon:yes stop_codon:yes gene_type:complete